MVIVVSSMALLGYAYGSLTLYQIPSYFPMALPTAAAFLVARCSPPDKYFTVLDAFFHSQEKMYETRDLRTPLFAAGHLGGLDDAAIQACLQDKGQIQALTDRLKAPEGGRQPAWDPTHGEPATFLFAPVQHARWALVVVVPEMADPPSP